MFLIFPILTIFYLLIERDGIQASGMMFMVMNVVMPPITLLASAVSEEREKGTLRSLIFAGIKPIEFFVGVGLCMGMFNFASTCIIGIILGNGDGAGLILATAGIAIICSMLFGITLGLYTKNQVNVAPSSATLSMLLGISAVLGSANEKVYKVTRFFYTQVTMDIFLENEISRGQFLILFTNFLFFLILFILIYLRRNKAD